MIRNMIGEEWCTYVGDSMHNERDCSYHQWNREAAIIKVADLEAQFAQARKWARLWKGAAKQWRRIAVRWSLIHERRGKR